VFDSEAQLLTLY